MEIKKAIKLFGLSQEWAKQFSDDELFDMGIESPEEQILIYAEYVGIDADQIDWSEWEEFCRLLT